jgi:RNA polymerase sigma-70 factor (ECF subfamily)
MIPNKKEKSLFIETLYKDMAHKLLLYAIHRIPDKDNAEDILHETFKTLWLKIDEVMKLENPNGWVFNTMVFCTLKHLDKIEHEEKIYSQTPYSEAEVMVETDFDCEISFSDSLSENELHILRLKEQGYTHNEIGEMMGFTTGTISSKVSRMKEKLTEFTGGTKL